jgi:hypothetical protein
MLDAAVAVAVAAAAVVLVDPAADTVEGSESVAAVVAIVAAERRCGGLG